MNFKEGDVVQLKSGGPRMTITGIIGESDQNSPLNLRALQKVAGFENGDVTVQYFDGARLEKAVFKKTVIELCQS